MFVVANGVQVPNREKEAVGKNSPKSKVSGGCSDGAVDVFGLSPELGGGGGGGAGDRSAEPTSFSFMLEKPVLALVARLLVGQEVEFSREAGTSIAARVAGVIIGYVPTQFRSRVAAVLAREAYTAVIQDIAHHTVRLRVTA